MTSGVDGGELARRGGGAELAATAGAARAGWSSTDALLLAMVLIWGVNFSVVKDATGIIDPLAFNGTRVALAAVTLIAIAALRGGAAPAPRDRLVLLALGVLGCGLYQFLFIEGIARTKAGNAALVQAAGPAFIALIAWLMRVERVSRRGWLGIALSLAGVSLINLERPDAAAGSATVLGNLLVLAAAFCWAAFAVAVKRYDGRIDPLQLTAYTMAGGAIALGLVSAPAILRADWAAAPPRIYGAIVYAGIGALVVAYLFWYRGVRVLGPTRTAMYSNLQPVIAILVAWLWRSEAPTALQVIGTATVVGGVVLTRP